MFLAVQDITLADHILKEDNMRTTNVLSFNELVRAINSGYMRFGNSGSVQVVRDHYKQVTDVDTLKQMLDWVQFAINDQPFNRGFYATRRAILSRIDYFSSTSTNK